VDLEPTHDCDDGGSAHESSRSQLRVTPVLTQPPRRDQTCGGDCRPRSRSPHDRSPDDSARRRCRHDCDDRRNDPSPPPPPPPPPPRPSRDERGKGPQKRQKKAPQQRSER
jgi:hypothetical protein